MEEKVRLSILDIEKKYSYEPTEAVYGTEQIVQWGPENDAPILYRNCYRKSATLKSIIDGSVNYILGDGIEVNAAYWAESVNRRGMTMRQFVAHLALSYQVYGGFAFQVVYNQLGSPVELFPLQFANCRTNEAGTKIWYAKKWTKWSQKADVYDAWNPKKIDPKNPTQIFYCKGDFTNGVYPLPPYYGAIADVLTEIECGKYSLNSVSTGFAAKYVINFPESNNLTDEQKKGLEDAIKTKFCGSEPEANFLMYWSEDGQKKIEVTKIEGDEGPERYIAVKDNARTNIFISMRATPVLFGLPNITNGFSTNEYNDCATLYEKTVIDPIRDIIKEAIDKVTGIEDSITIVPMNLTFGQKN